MAHEVLESCQNVTNSEITKRRKLRLADGTIDLRSQNSIGLDDYIPSGSYSPSCIFCAACPLSILDFVPLTLAVAKAEDIVCTPFTIDLPPSLS